MTVYFELAFAENMLLDGVLLYLSLKCARARVRAVRLLLAAAVGGGEALLFPLVSLPYPLALLLKFLGGLLLALIAVKGTPFTHFVAAGAFFAAEERGEVRPGKPRPRVENGARRHIQTGPPGRAA